MVGAAGTLTVPLALTPGWPVNQALQVQFLVLEPAATLWISNPLALLIRHGG